MNLLQNYFEDKGVEYSKLDSDDRVTISDIMDEVDNIQSFLYDCSDEIVNTFKNVYNSVNAFYYELSEILKNEDDYNEAINNSDELTEQEKEILLKNEDLLDDIDN
jgi:GTP1/Obg family GTP-binding protein